MSKTERAVLFANGLAEAPERLRLLPSDYLIAVDGGLHPVQALGLTPNVLIGDLDSITPEEVAECQQAGVEILRYPTAKDQTDLELALELALNRGYRKILIAFGLGGRLDHILGNLALLLHPDLQDNDIRLDDGQTEVLLLRGRGNLGCQPGEVVSLIPWGSNARGVNTSGLAYPLTNESLYVCRSRGVSNLTTGAFFTVSLRKGALLVIHHRSEPNNEEKLPS